MSDNLVGQLINNKYRVLSVIGKGGMGRVYRAEQVPLGRPVALKVLHAAPGQDEADPAFQRRFFLEASLCAKLSHPNIVTIYDYGRIEAVSPESYFMAMEFLEGETLHKRLRGKEAGLSTPEAVGIALEIARGLREAHRNGIVHRDLKPANIMLIPDEETGEKLKILDFGLVKQFEGEDKEDLTKEGSFLGSPKYMAPEQIEHAAIDHRTDLYSLGVIFYECLCGKVPFEGSSSMHTLLAHSQSPVPPMAERNPKSQVHPFLEAVAKRLLSKKPEERYANADELLRELRRVQTALGIEHRFSGRTLSESGAFTAAELPVAPEPSHSIVGTTVSSRSGVTPAIPSQNSRTLLLVGGGLALLALFAGIGFSMRRPAQVQAASSGTNTNTPPAVQSYTLHIESNPVGATVTEGGRVLGVTPLEIALDSAQVSPREFRLTLQGHTPYTLRQPPTHSDVRVVAALVANAPTPVVAAVQEPTQPAVAPEPPAPTPRPSTGGRRYPAVRVRPPQTNTATTPPAATTSPLDIRTER